MPNSPSSSPRLKPAHMLTSIMSDGDEIGGTTSHDQLRGNAGFRQTSVTDDGISMTDFNETLPHVGGPTPQSYIVSAPIYQYQQSSPTYAVGQYQPLPPGSTSPTTYNSPITDGTGVMNQQYFPFQVAQQQLDTSQTAYQFGGQGGYRNTAPTPVGGQQFPSGFVRPVQPQAPSLRYQYPQWPQQHPHSDRAMSFHAVYSPSPANRTSPYVQQSSPFAMYPPSFMHNVGGQLHPSSGDETSISPDAENLLPRGPPRKPKQSGFALWVGNLPRDVALGELKEYFAMDTLESIFLIRKSNCAFVNYKTEEACATALSMFNDKTFKNVRLVCRLRRSSPIRPATGSSGIASSSSGSTVPDTPASTISPLPQGIMGGTESQSAVSNKQVDPTPSSTPTKSRYFIMKSLTKEDLAWSVANKVWATQPHNEVVLNEAFENSEDVFLIFSVNKSGEFFGYARMASDIQAGSEGDASKGPETKTEEPSPVLLAGPKTTVTPRTNAAPRGKIFEDEVRGTVFWEVADSSDDDEVAEGEQLQKEGHAWGNPFKIEWIKWDTPVPFQRTRLLRNPWNGNREVKISRDGTEIEPSVGARLLQEFDAEPVALGSGLLGSVGQSPNCRRMSYPGTQFRPVGGPQQFMYQQQSSQPAPQGMTYFPYAAASAPQPVMYSFGRGVPGPLQQSFGSGGQQYPPYGQRPQ